LSRAFTFFVLRGKAWMAGTSPAMTVEKHRAFQPNPILIGRHGCAALHLISRHLFSITEESA